MSRLSDWTKLRGIEIGIVFQDFFLLPTLTAVENGEMAMIGPGVPTRERARRAAALLEEVGLSERLNHLPSALSGGERQRVSIARSIANGPALLLSDEPTGNLDTTNAALVIDLVRSQPSFRECPRKDIEVKLAGGMLTIKGEKSEQTEKKKKDV